VDKKAQILASLHVWGIVILKNLLDTALACVH
jgi:hypothetical protein